MVQLKVLSGKMAGTDKVARRFPFRIGRSAAADLCLEEDGVWEVHLELTFHRDTGFTMATKSHALASVNGKPVREAVLRNGDIIEIGASKIRFWLAATRQGSLWLREGLAWTGLAAITAGQLALIYWLVR